MGLGVGRDVGEALVDLEVGEIVGKEPVDADLAPQDARTMITRDAKMAKLVRRRKRFVCTMLTPRDELLGY